ncbi:hypothetical protein B4168_1913 [Anoxybacillus flavithermus]|nr:hypothetical protein B4168_1913 [Anoxybacillus flavithermus]OAO85569.1 hypothetical protein GT23_2472 [Parageobacillus thermoglucosidasius]
MFHQQRLCLFHLLFLRKTSKFNLYGFLFYQFIISIVCC